MTAAQFTALVVASALMTALSASMQAARPDCSSADILVRAGNNAAMAISYLGEES